MTAEQADTESPPAPVTLEWEGETFEVAERLGSMPFMRFAKAAEAGVDADEMEGLVVMSDLLESCLTPESWVRFQHHATAIKASGSECLALVRLALEAKAQRPTLRSSDSSDGPATTRDNSADDSVQRVLDRIPTGRPDLKLAVWRGSRAAAANRPVSA